MTTDASPMALAAGQTASGGRAVPEEASAYVLLRRDGVLGLSARIRRGELTFEAAAAALDEMLRAAV